jgi:hypothetical protein
VQRHTVEWRGRRYPYSLGYFQVGRSSLDDQNHWFYVEYPVDGKPAEYTVIRKGTMSRRYAGAIFVYSRAGSLGRITDFKARAKEHFDRICKQFNITS